MRTLLAAILSTYLLLAPTARAQWAVFDAANYGQNLLEAARALEEIENQVIQIQEYVTMLEYQARNVASLGFSAVADFNGAIGRITDLMSRAQGILFDIRDVEQQFARFFPETYDSNLPNAQLIADARTRWQYAQAAFHHVMTVESEIVGQVAGDQQLMSALIGQSQSAVGILQAAQAGNQLLALHIKQTSALQALLAAQGRAEVLETARRAEAQEQGHEQLQRFLGGSMPYVPEPVLMFHE